MKFRKLIAITLSAVTVFALAACGAKKEMETPKGPVGIFITYGEENESYAFVDPETDTVFLAELPLDKISDKKGNSLEFEDLKDGDKLQLVGSGIMTASIPPIYAGITEVIRLENGNDDIVDKYYPMIEEALVPEIDPSMVPQCNIEISQSYGDVINAIFETNYDWTYTDEEGNEQHKSSVNETLIENEPFTMESETVEANISFTITPTELKLFAYANNESQEIELVKDGSNYTVTLKAGQTYELVGTWENGTVNYQFNTKLIEQR